MMRMHYLWPILIGCLLANVPAFSQGPNGGAPTGIDYETAYLDKHVTAVRVTEEISIDGYLDEAAWDIAVPATDFTQWRPVPGDLATERTEVRFLYDDDNLYVGFIAFDSGAAEIVVNEIREDFQYQATDGVSMIIDSLNDDRSGFLFGTNPAGARRDSQVTSGGTNNDWDAVWDVQVSINGEGWIAEFVIPFKTLRFADSPSQEWGVNMHRLVLGLNEESMWSPIPVRFRGLVRVSLAGTLHGIENISQGMNLKVKPFVTAGITQTRAAADPFGAFENDQNYDGGVDLKYSVTPSLTLDATYRTDFAQVEADQQQVNLTRFNLFFPEKREFFLENAGTFSFGAEGGGGFGRNRANLIPFFSRRIGLSPSGTPTPIIGGGRLTGQLGRYDIGFLTMKTEDEDTTPSNNYMVGRVKRNLLTNSWIGAIVTHRDSTIDGDYNRVYGADAYFQFYNRLEFDTYLLGSDTPGLSGRDSARKFKVGWDDDELSTSVEYNSIEENFNPEVGFVRRGDITHYAGAFTWSPQLRTSETFRSFSVGTNAAYYENATTGEIETRTQELSLGLQFENTSSINFSVDQTFDRLTEEARIQGIPIPLGDHRYLRYSASFRTDRSEKISGSAGVDWGEFWDGHRKSLDAALGLKPNYRTNLDLTYSRNLIDLSTGRSTSDLVGARFLYGFSPRSFFNAFLQYNGATQEISTNIRFNIMYRPLSDLYLVYNDRRSTDNGQLVERAFIVKLTNLISF